MSQDPLHQLVPAYRFTGSRVLCMWHEDSVGHHIALAKDLNQLNNMLPAILWKKHPEIKSYWEIDIVMPPPYISQRFATAKAEHELDLFEYWFLELAESYKTIHKKLPMGISECPGFNGADEYKRYHIGCNNCDGKNMILAGLDMRQLLEQHKSKFRSDKRSGWHGSATMFDGQPYDPSRKLYMAYLNGGPHRPGVVISTIKEVEKHPLSEYTLFFFHGEKKPIPRCLTDTYKKYEAELAERKKQYEAAQKKKVWELKVERAKLVTEIFGD